MICWDRVQRIRTSECGMKKALSGASVNLLRRLVCSSNFLRQRLTQLTATAGSSAKLKSTSDNTSHNTDHQDKGKRAHPWRVSHERLSQRKQCRKTTTAYVAHHCGPFTVLTMLLLVAEAPLSGKISSSELQSGTGQY